MNIRIYPAKEYDYPNSFEKPNLYCLKCYHFNLTPILKIVYRNGVSIKYECSECKYNGHFISREDVRLFKIKYLLNV